MQTWIIWDLSLLILWFLISWIISWPSAWYLSLNVNVQNLHKYDLCTEWIVLKSSNFDETEHCCTQFPHKYGLLDFKGFARFTASECCWSVFVVWNSRLHFSLLISSFLISFSCLTLSIGDWVLYKRGLDGDNSYLILEKENYIFFDFILCNFLVRMLRCFYAKIFFFFNFQKLFDPKT